MKWRFCSLLLILSASCLTSGDGEKFRRINVLEYFNMNAAHFLRWPDGCAAQVEQGGRHRSLFARTLTLTFTDTLINCVCACICTKRLHQTAKMYHTLGVRHPHRTNIHARRTHACTRKHARTCTYTRVRTHMHAHACAHTLSTSFCSSLSLSLVRSRARALSLSLTPPSPPLPSRSLCLCLSLFRSLFLSLFFSLSLSRSFSLCVSLPLSPSLPPSLSLHPLSLSLVCALSEPHITISLTHTATVESLSAGYQYHVPNITLDYTAP